MVMVMVIVMVVVMVMVVVGRCHLSKATRPQRTARVLEPTGVGERVCPGRQVAGESAHSKPTYAPTHRPNHTLTRTHTYAHTYHTPTPSCPSPRCIPGLVEAGVEAALAGGGAHVALASAPAQVPLEVMAVVVVMMVMVLLGVRVQIVSGCESEGVCACVCMFVQPDSRVSSWMGTTCGSSATVCGSSAMFTAVTPCQPRGHIDHSTYPGTIEIMMEVTDVCA